MRPSPREIHTVTSIGAGPIGGGWAAFFLSRGYQVRAYLHSMDEKPIFRAIIDTAWRFDRVLASRLGVGAVEALLSGHTAVMAGMVNDEVVYTPFPEAINRKNKGLDEELRVAQILSI